MRLAGACDRANNSEHEALIKRIGTAVAKYWTTKRAPVHTAEALECLGGNGYVEESIMPRLYRQAPLNSIWEGSGNLNCLDVLRAMRREPGTLEGFFADAFCTSRLAGNWGRAFGTLPSGVNGTTIVERARPKV